MITELVRVICSETAIGNYPPSAQRHESGPLLPSKDPDLRIWPLLNMVPQEVADSVRLQRVVFVWLKAGVGSEVSGQEHDRLLSLEKRLLDRHEIFLAVDHQAKREAFFRRQQLRPS